MNLYEKDLLPLVAEKLDYSPGTHQVLSVRLISLLMSRLESLFIIVLKSLAFGITRKEKDGKLNVTVINILIVSLASMLVNHLNM